MWFGRRFDSLKRLTLVVVDDFVIGIVLKLETSSVQISLSLGSQFSSGGGESGGPPPPDPPAPHPPPMHPRPPHKIKGQPLRQSSKPQEPPQPKIPQPLSQANCPHAG